MKNWTILLEVAVCATSIGEVLSERNVFGVKNLKDDERKTRNNVYIRQPDTPITLQDVFIRINRTLEIQELIENLDEDGFSILDSAEEAVAAIEEAIRRDVFDALLELPVYEDDDQHHVLRASVLALCTQLPREIICMHRPQGGNERIQRLVREDGRNTIGEGMILVVSHKKEVAEVAA